MVVGIEEKVDTDLDRLDAQIVILRSQLVLVRVDRGQVEHEPVVVLAVEVTVLHESQVLFSDGSLYTWGHSGGENTLLLTSF